MWGILVALISGALMSIQGVFNTEVTKQTSLWVSTGWVQLSAFAVCVLAVSYTHLDVYKRQSLTKDVTYEEVKAAYDACYENETFVRVLDKDVCPQTKWVEGSNYVDVNFKIDPRTHRIIMMGAIDNLVKGAAGQAVQNMNLMFGFNEAEGLLQVPMYP